ncbi:MAG: helix-turn-helix transcriptional regulator [Chloroflexi bacterium]|nr:helix-turn-helix transcriptional regulator [Chloroflexota bacterium]
MMGDRGFGGWLEASMRSRGITQAQLARSVGVADTQISRWRRGQVVPSLQYLQRLADAFGVERVALDELVGLPVAQLRSERDSHADPQLEAELQAHQARLRQVMQTSLPPGMWRAYVEACVALAEGLSASTRRALRESLPEPRSAGEPPISDASAEGPPERRHDRPLGFRP